MALTHVFAPVRRSNFDHNSVTIQHSGLIKTTCDVLWEDVRFGRRRVVATLLPDDLKAVLLRYPASSNIRPLLILTWRREASSGLNFSSDTAVTRGFAAGMGDQRAFIN